MSAKVPRSPKAIKTTPATAELAKLTKPKDASKKPSKHGILTPRVELKKKHRFKPGTLANIEIRRYQSSKSEELLIPKAHIYRATKEMMGEIGDFRITKEALYAIRLAVDQEAVRQLAAANRMAIHANRITIMPKDFDAVTDVRLIYPDLGMKNTEHSQRYLVARQERLLKSVSLLKNRRETLKDRVTEINEVSEALQNISGTCA